MEHLAAFRVAITISAVVSTLVLNAITALTAYRLGQQRWPERWPFGEDHRNGLIAAGSFLLLFATSLAGYLTYGGLSDPKKLPNLTTFLAGLVGLALPLALLFLFREEVNPRLRRRYRTR
jgi:Co/Zn/Cd efflux system component